MIERRLLESARALLESHQAVEESFLDGTGFFIGDRFVVAVTSSGLCLQAGTDEYGPPQAGPFEFAGRAVPGWVYVDGMSLDDETLASWIEVALSRAEVDSG